MAELATTTGWENQDHAKVTRATVAMCGRTSLANLPEHLQPFLLRYGIRDVPPWYTPRYNIAPTQDQMIIVEQGGQREALPMRWGLIPSWAKDPAIGSRMINARAETLATKPAYRDAFAKRRGLMVVDSYYEWRTNRSGPKTPFRIHLAGDLPFTIAALWERWRSSDAEIETCTVITTDASEAMQGIHHRMPVIIGEASAEAWLSASTPMREIDAILSADGAAGLIAYPVSLYVNAPSNNGARCWEPVADE